jgi:hypothetical protein
MKQSERRENQTGWNGCAVVRAKAKMHENKRKENKKESEREERLRF